MTAEELLKSIIAYGADESGIHDRFSGNAALYESCFTDFLAEPNFAALRDAMNARDYERAFSSAHALKGVAGNLGVTAFYADVCTLVESLRAGQYETVEAEYKAVVEERARLASLLSGETPAPATVATATVATATVATATVAAATVAPATGESAKESANEQQQRDQRAFLTHAAVLLTILLAGVAWLFCRIYLVYRDNAVRESADHLVGINDQLKLYIEETIANDWKVARSVGDSLADSNYTDDDDAVFQMMANKRDVWQATDIMLYTEAGYGISADGSIESNDVASETVLQARANGKYMSIIDSDIYYTVPITTDLTYRGSRVVAVSTVQDMGAFLDDMGFSSFGGQAWMYLTDENGVVISRLSNDAATPAFNFMAIVEGRELTPITDGQGTVDALMTTVAPSAFLITADNGKNYIVSTPIASGSGQLRLLYLVPERVVNSTVTGFSKQLISLSGFVILSFAALAVLILLFVYRIRKRAFDRALLARERMFDLLVENTQTAFALFELGSTEAAYISSNAEEIIGDPPILLEKTDMGFSMQGRAGADTPAVHAVNERMQGWDGTGVFRSGYLLNDRAVPPRYFEVSLFPTGDGDTTFVGIAQDVTQAHAREKTTSDALAMAERANEAKSRFLSNMSHDIRTPMNAIVNMTDFAIHSIGEPKKLASYLQTIRESSDHLLRLINDVLDMSRIESGQTVVLSEPFDLTAELAHAAAIIKPLCAEKKQTLITDFTGLGAADVRGDRLMFSQIVMNLLGNAVKFTPEHGAVRFVAAELPALRPEIVNLRITVEDNGIGISKDFLPHIFEPFSRADNKRVSKTEGTGLGLSICHSYVAAMGGTITCESEVDEGTTFIVELYFDKADAADATVDPSAFGETPFLGKRCLVCEDNGINQTIAKTMLEQLGFLVDIAADGWEGVQKFKGGAPGRYDIIYMDIQMPVMDGYQATVAIRESERPDAKTVPIVAMTANVFAKDIEKARIAGMDGYLGKPILSYNLLEETDRAMRKRKDASV